MKITRNTPDQLIVENNPIWMAILISLFGLVFAAIGLFNLTTEPGTGLLFLLAGVGMAVGFNMIFIRRTQLILGRGRALVELRRRSWFRYTRMTWDLKFLDRARVQTSSSGDTNTHRAVLIITGGMDAGTHPVTLVYSSGRGAHRCADAVNAWLAKLDRSAPTP